MPDETKNFALQNRREAGFSLIEVMISLAVFLIFISAVYGLLRIANIQKSTINSQTEAMKNLRLSLNTLGRDAVNAGLGYSRIGGNMPDNLTNAQMNLPADTNNTQDLLTAVISGNNINNNQFLPNTERTDVVAFAYLDKSFNGGAAMPIPDSAIYNTSGITLTAAPTGSTVDDRPNKFDLYFISEGNTRTAMALVTNKTNDTTLHVEIVDPLGINAAANAPTVSKSRLTKCVSVGETACMNFTNIGGLASVTAKKILWVSYSVTNDGTLVRTTYGNNKAGTIPADQIQKQPIAYGIQNFQVRYLMRDGTFTDNPSANGTNQAALNSVVQVQATITARVSVEENGVNIEKVVDLKSTFSTKNLNYDAN